MYATAHVRRQIAATHRGYKSLRRKLVAATKLTTFLSQRVRNELTTRLVGTTYKTRNDILRS